MTTGRVEVTIEGVNQQRVKLGRFGGSVLPAQRLAILEEATEFGVRIAQENAPVDLGFGRANIYAEVNEFAAAIITPDAYMVVQEFGRRPGSMPPPQALKGWAGRHGFGTDNASLYMLAQSIGRKGFEAKLFMTKAAVACEAFVQLRVAKASAIITTWWDSN